jgi:sn-glycerol 3-phosphate transport system substrate-binding protein
MTMKLMAAAGLAAGLMLAAAPASAQERTKFEFWHGLTGKLGEIVEQHCGRFNKSQTKYEAVCVGQGGYDRAEQNTIAAFRSKQHPTMVQIYDAGTVNFMLSGAIYPASQLVKDFGLKVDWANYFPSISNYYATSKGEMWSFPYNSSTALFYWNADLFAKAGMTEAPKTIEEWDVALAKLKGAGVDCGFAFDFDTWMPLEQFSAIHNIPLATKNNGYDGLDAELIFNKTKFADYMKLWKSWLDKGYARIQTAQVGKTLQQAFADGSCAVMLTSVANHGVVGGLVNNAFKWDVAMLPIYAGTQRHNSIVGGASLWTLQGKAKGEYEGAAAFLQFIAQPTEEEWFATNTGYIPVTKTGFDYLVKKGFYEQPGIKGREIAMQSLTFTPPNAITRGIRLGNFTQIRAEIRAELEAAFTGKKDVQVALDDAASRSNQLLRRFEQTFKGKPLP